MKAAGNILFCGVGGQGILLASEVTAYALLEEGLDAKKSEVHGMAQRGGSVVANLRFGAKVYSPLIDPGQADYVVAFEMMEAARYLPFMHPGTKVVVNTHTIAPPVVATGNAIYPDRLIDLIEANGIYVLPVNGFEIAKGVGEIRAANIALVGALSAYLPVAEETFVKVMKDKLPAKILDLNLKAFAAGRKAALA
nr:indolepyruvate oxidoreductase subunit beta [Desulfobulbaceae bacterium]